MYMEKKVESIKKVSDFFMTLRHIVVYCTIFFTICIIFVYGVNFSTEYSKELAVITISFFISTLPLLCLEKFFYALYIIALSNLKNLYTDNRL